MYMMIEQPQSIEHRSVASDIALLEEMKAKCPDPHKKLTTILCEEILRHHVLVDNMEEKH